MGKLEHTYVVYQLERMGMIWRKNSSTYTSTKRLIYFDHKI